mgnify:CR=1 FL=1
MKIPLRFQMTENDSGKTTLLNTISYLFDREDIDNSLIKSIYKHTINEDNILKEQETICAWGKKLFKKNKYKLDLNYLSKEEVNLKIIKDFFKENCCMIVRVYLNGKSHYCLATLLDSTYIYLFDPYYLDEVYFDIERMVELVFDNPFNYNRKVNLKRFNGMTLNDFSLGPIEHRECLMIKKIK